MATVFTRYAPFDSGAGAAAMETEWRAMMGRNHQSGVIASNEDPGFSNELEVETGSASREILVRPGEVWIRGHWGKTDSARTFQITDAHATLDRIDRVVARANFDADTVELDVLTGVAADPAVAPPLTQNTGATWEIPLAQVSVPAGSSSVSADDITDDRQRFGFKRWTTWTPPLWYEGATFGTRSKNAVNLGTGSTRLCRYIQVDKVLFIRWFFRWGPEATEAEWDGGEGRVFTELPPGLESAPTGDNRLPTHLWVHNRRPKGSGSWNDDDWHGTSLVSPADTLVFPFFATAPGDTRILWYRIEGEGSLDEVPYSGGTDAYAEGGHLIISGTVEIK
ncbi:hypothetical protein [Actinopolyspora halophila]|uniref:hypothetical protein n=1 Tax=Actinopolyspora halophila TaxID=1850 RepID=UPI00035C20C6|nr:hypothetical protein [Actinopolyspora halophila]